MLFRSDSRRPDSTSSQLTAPPSYESRPSSPTEQEQNATASSTLACSNAPSQALPPLPESKALTWDPNSDPTFRDQLESHLVPIANVKYSFTQVSMNAMAMVTPSPGTTSKFHISVESNCFIPSASITTIREGGTGDGSFLASFQTCVVRDTYVPEFVRMRGQERTISRVFRRTTLNASKWIDRFKEEPMISEHWQFGETDLYWDVGLFRGKKRKLCYDSPEVPRTKATLLAEFKSSSGVRGWGSDYLATLEVTREGHQNGLLEDILVSALILERLELSRVKDSVPTHS
ncbi:hypothetical protein V5O48_016095 [Marasmius crinis-equi]|uniref:DUF6593 domain-containing protein n=1 Tax=Marasmius crinis-equi TaxID=585013 RepID=A0ABR3ESR7_9AGAR